MVERGDIISTKEPIISKDIATDDSEEDIVTSTQEEIKIGVNKKSLLKVMKLVNKSVKGILKGF
jgi:hypothetical protein